jgi:hypothetical protein
VRVDRVALENGAPGDADWPAGMSAAGALSPTFTDGFRPRGSTTSIHLPIGTLYSAVRLTLWVALNI